MENNMLNENSEQDFQIKVVISIFLTEMVCFSNR
jgi:hypothetical protein